MDKANRPCSDRTVRKIVMSSRWRLLRNRQHITQEHDQLRLNELLAANQALMTIYRLKDDLVALWNYRHK